MKKRDIFIASTILLLILFISGFKYFSQEANLIVLLSCEGEPSGSLSATFSGQDKSRLGTSFDVKKICTQEQFEIENYHGEDVQFIYTLSKNNSIKLLVRYGEDIQVDRVDGYYTILELKSMLPFIKSSRI